MGESDRSGPERGAAAVEHTFDIVEVQHQAAADGGELFGIGSDPRVLDDAEIVAPTLERLGNRGAEAGESIDQWRNAAGEAESVAQGAGGEAAAIGGEIEDGDVADESGREVLARIGRVRLAEDEKIGVVAGGEIVKQGGGPEGSAAGYRVRSFGAEEEGSGLIRHATRRGSRSGPRALRNGAYSA